MTFNPAWPFGNQHKRPDPVVYGFSRQVIPKPRDRDDIMEVSGWAGLGGATLPDSVLQLEYAPYEWLFPRMAAVVHHGGMGTLGAGLRAGRPALVIPRFADQPMWARRLQALGVSPPPIPHRRLTAERLARALQQLTGDAALRERAASLGEKVRAGDGVGEAVRFLTRALKNSPRRRRQVN